MRAGLAKKLSAACSAAVLSLSFSLMPLAQTYASSPYLKVLGGDTSAGGWFGGSGSCTANANFQDDSYKGDDSYGGIYTFAQSTGGGYEGSSSEYAAFALGKIEGGTAPNGFYSDSKLNPASPTVLSFANINSLGKTKFAGGLWGGSVPNAAQCIPDYYSSKKPASTSPLASRGLSSVAAKGSKSYTADGTSSPFALLPSDISVAASANVSVFVNGNVYIDHNITYDSHNADDIPRFALVAAGSIYIDPSVTELDGLYIAQPAPSDIPKSDNSIVDNDTGVIWTCHDGSTAIPLGPYVAGSCKKQLTFNGAVIAKQVQLMRVGGDVNDNNSNPAEVFNYTPEMVIGGPFFPNSGGTAGSGQPVFQSIISLPPIF